MIKNSNNRFLSDLYIFLFYSGILSLLFYSLSFSYLYANTSSIIQSDNIIYSLMCNVIYVISGPIAQGIATLVIVVTGYSFFMGKVSSTMLFIIAGGIALVFGAETLMSWLMGADLNECELTAIDGNVEQI